MAAVAATWSRRSNRSRASGDSEVGNSIRITPGMVWVLTGKPLSRNTLIIWWFWGSTSASSSWTPISLAASASWPSRIVPSPLPCMRSAISRATSARSGWSGWRSKPAWPTTRPSVPVVATSPYRRS